VNGMRIAYVINSVEGGGAAQPVPAIAEVLRAGGAQVRLFALRSSDRRGLPAIVEAGLLPRVREGGTADHLAAALWLRREMIARGATHIWTSLSRATILGLIIGPSLRLPVVCWQHAAFLKPWNERLMRLLAPRAALWVGDSQSVTDLTQHRLQVPDERLRCWPIYAVDPAMPQASPWQAGEPIRIGSLGRLHRVKGYDILIAALAHIKARGLATPPFSLAIAGEGSERGRLEMLARNAGIDVEFAGFTDDPKSFLAGLHLYVQPSRSEGFCIAAHEAMAAGLPVIASAVGEMPYSIMPGVSGLTCPPADPDGLAHALETLLATPSRLEEMGQAARNLVNQRYSRERFDRTGTAILTHIRQAHA